MLGITDALIQGKNRPGRKLYNLKGIVIHEGDHYDLKNSSIHYIVDKDSIIRCIPDNEIALHTGSTSYTIDIDQLFEGDNPNNYLIGIKICNDDWDEAIKNAIELVAYLLKIYGLSVDNLWRHFDITGKNCPAIMVEDSTKWIEFKNRVNNINNNVLNIQPYQATGIVKCNLLNVRSGPNSSYEILTQIKNGDQVEIVGLESDWFKLNNGGWVLSIYIDVSEPIYKIVTANTLNVRNKADIDSDIIGQLKQNEQIQIIEQLGDWSSIYYEDKKGYIATQYVM